MKTLYFLHFIGFYFAIWIVFQKMFTVVSFREGRSGYSKHNFLARLSLYSIAMVRPPSIVPPSVVHHFQRSSSPKLLGLSKPNFIWSLSGMRERKFVRGVLVTWPGWPPRPYMVKTFKNLLQNQRANELVAWYVALGTRAHHSLFKWWP